MSADVWESSEGVPPRTRTRQLCAVDPITAGVFGGAFSGLFGLIGGLIVGLMSLGGTGEAATAGLVVAISMPFIDAVLGALMTWLMALLYNLAAGLMGGIRMELATKRC